MCVAGKLFINCMVFYFWVEDMNNSQIDIEIKEKIIRLVVAMIPQVKKIYLFGSRARGTHSPRSDIDIAIDANRKLSTVEIGELKSVLSETNIIYKIDVVDINSIPEDLRKTILQEGVLWKPFPSYLLTMQNILKRINF